MSRDARDAPTGGHEGYFILTKGGKGDVIFNPVPEAINESASASLLATRDANGVT